MVMDVDEKADQTTTSPHISVARASPNNLDKFKSSFRDSVSALSRSLPPPTFAAYKSIITWFLAGRLSKCELDPMLRSLFAKVDNGLRLHNHFISSMICYVGEIEEETRHELIYDSTTIGLSTPLLLLSEFLPRSEDEDLIRKSLANPPTKSICLTSPTSSAMGNKMEIPMAQALSLGRNLLCADTRGIADSTAIKNRMNLICKQYGLEESAGQDEVELLRELFENEVKAMLRLVLLRNNDNHSEDETEPLVKKRRILENEDVRFGMSLGHHYLQLLHLH